MAASRKTASSSPPRRSIPSREFADHWDLSDLITDPVKQFDRYLKDLTAKVERFQSARQVLAPTMSEQTFLDFLTLEYYPRLLDPGLTSAERASEAAKILRRLSPISGDPIWGASC